MSAVFHHCTRQGKLIPDLCYKNWEVQGQKHFMYSHMHVGKGRNNCALKMTYKIRQFIFRPFAHIIQYFQTASKALKINDLHISGGPVILISYQ